MRTPGSPELLEQRRLIAARMFKRGDDAADKAATVQASAPHLLHACLRQTGLHHALYPRSPQ